MDRVRFGILNPESIGVPAILVHNPQHIAT